MLHLALHLAYLILQLPARALEGIVDVRITLVVLRRAADIDLAAFRQGEVNCDLVEPTGAVMATRRLHDHAAGGDPAGTFLELRDVFVDFGADVRPRINALKVDLQRRFNVRLRSSLIVE